MAGRGSRRLPSNATSRNGWVWFTDGVGAYDSDYTLRAFIASHRPASGTKNGELQPVARADSDGHPLNGANVYVLHFRRDQLPPVRGFWSLTAYTKDGALLDAKVPRLTLTDRDRLRKKPRWFRRYPDRGDESRQGAGGELAAGAGGRLSN